MKVLQSRTVKVGTLTAALVLGVGATAFARVGNGPIDIQDADNNVEFVGSVSWYPNSQTVGYGHGGMVVSGKLYDRKSNGHWVYVSAKVEGYGYTKLKENHNGYGTYVTLAATEVYDPAATYDTTGAVKACQDDAFSDTCAAEGMTRN